MSEELGNWIAKIAWYGEIGFWQCTRAQAEEVAAQKSAWENSLGRKGWSVRPATDAPEDQARLEPGRAGCYDVGEREAS